MRAIRYSNEPTYSWFSLQDYNNNNYYYSTTATNTYRLQDSVCAFATFGKRDSVLGTDVFFQIYGCGAGSASESLDSPVFLQLYAISKVDGMIRRNGIRVPSSS